MRANIFSFSSILLALLRLCLLSLAAKISLYMLIFWLRVSIWLHRDLTLSIEDECLAKPGHFLLRLADEIRVCDLVSWILCVSSTFE